MATPRTERPLRPRTVLLGLLALALNLRAALAGYPPLLETARTGLGVTSAAAGLVQTGAVLMMAVGSLAGAAAGERIGRERALTAALTLVAAGSLVRGAPTLPALIGGSLLVGFGIGVAGALLAGVVKQRLASRAGAVTGGYVVAMMVGSTIAGAAAVPMAVALGGWSASLAVWAVPALLAVAVWAPVARRAGPGEPAARTRLPWRDPFARLAAAYLAGSSLLVYGWLTWLSPYYESRGWAPEAAGLLVAVWSIAHVPSALAVPALAERRRRWRFWAGATLAVITVGTLGVLLAPEPPVVGPWLWVVLIGLGAGAGFPLGLAVIAWRTPDGAAGAAVSGMAMGVGYTVAGLGPLLMGLLIDLTGGFGAAVGVLLGAAALQAVAILRIGDPPRG
ncbi:MFS transporter [Pseudonocardia humida]|uniref:MFS transporter n=1 Tax=Pseudonocardia humida TaxID=2800819 RepID=A0ABT1A904_9PSEU|nr:MFS transporter [Pseudonocardia humida]MCO1659403.1 MFS transporter [Pseudonocardia humida]